MRTIYIDSDYICHADNADGRIEIHTDILNGICDVALECYILIPEHDDKVDFCQCFDNDKAGAIRRQNLIDESNSISIDEVSEIIEQLYEADLEMIGE